MKKHYLRPEITLFCHQPAALLSGSDSNRIAGSIHGKDGDETIGSGNEEDEGGWEASARAFSCDEMW